MSPVDFAFAKHDDGSAAVTVGKYRSRLRNAMDRGTGVAAKVHGARAARDPETIAAM